MKKMLILILLVPHIIEAQTTNSWDGAPYGFSSTAHIKMLNIFINVIYDVHPQWDPCINDATYWSNAYNEGVNNEAIPTYAIMDNVYDTNHLSGTITRLYGESSWHALQLTGTSIVVNVMESRILDIGIFNYGNIARCAIDVINEDGGINDSNSYTLYASSIYENSVWGNIYIRNIVKGYGNLGIGSGCGFCVKGLLINHIPYELCGTLQCVGGGDISQNPTAIFIHEISHSLFGSNDFHTSGGNHRSGTDSLMPFMTIQNGYGLMGAAGSSLVCCNGYERWRMHWKYPLAVDYISAMDSTGSVSVMSDVQKDDGNKTFLLRDFITYGDAVRIKLPYKDREDCSNQYIWLENHKVGSNGKLDFLQYANTYTCRPDSVAGIYAYYQIGRDILSGEDNAVRYKNERDNLKFIPAEGYFNYQKQETDTYNLQCVNWNNHHYILVRQSPNPFNGYQDMESQFHPQYNETIISTSNEYNMWRKIADNQNIDSLPSIGDSRDMFASYTKLNMATNPGTCNAKTYYNCLKANNTLNYDHYNPRHNRTTYLTGLSIEMIPQANKDFLVHIRWDDYDITNNAVFTGRIALRERAVLKAGNYITLTQNRTPAQPFRDSITGYFDTLTVMRCENGSEWVQERNTVMNITENSQLILQNGCTYTAYGNAHIHLTQGGMLKVEHGATMNMCDAALIVIDSSAVMVVEDSIFFGKNAKITVKQGGKLLVNDATLTSDSVSILWQGIEVWGTPSAGQYTVNPNTTSPLQGEVILNNAVIANAVCGVRAGRENRLNTGGGGGVIKATNTLFLNNKESVHFNAYSHVNAYNKVTDNISTFHHCTFSVNGNAYYTMDTGCVQVALHNVRGVRFNGCNFEDMQSKSDWTQQGTALYACNAGFRMNENTGIMTYPATCHDTACTFYNFKNGIAVTGPAEKPVHVYHAVFTNNSIGINAKNADALSVISCSFSSGSTSYSTDVHGLIADSCTMYRVENNTFTGIGNGIKIIGKTADNNTIRLNTFQNLCRGIEIYGLNGNGYGPNENLNYTALTGLQLKCNIFVEDSTDIYVDAPASVKRYQGYENEACGNYFEGESALHINNQSNKRIFYYYKSSVNAQNPYPSNQLFEAATANDVCGDRYGCIGSSYYNMPVSITECENMYNSTYNMYISALDNYLTLYEGIEIDWENVTGINGEENSQLGDLIHLSELKNTLDESCITAINILNNASEPMVSDIALWLERLSSLHANLLAARYYTLNTDVAQLQHIWSQIITSGSDIGTENTYDYQLCLNYLNTWSQDTSSTVTVSEYAIDSIRNIAMAHNTASLLAESVLEHINELYPHWKQHIHTSCIWVQPIASRPYRSSDIRNENAVIISPNPTNDIINIFTQNTTKITQITLYDIYGKQLINIKLNNDNYQVDMSPYAAGIYVLRCTLDNRQETVKKVVKQ